MDIFKEKLEEAIPYFEEGLPYWCDYFLRPQDERFCDFIKENGYRVHYLVLERFDQVYVPIDIEIELMRRTAKERAILRARGIREEDLPILL